MNKLNRLFVAAVAANTIAAFSAAGTTLNKISLEETAKRQARSVHLRYGGDISGRVAGAAVSVTVRESTPGSYFMALGWNCGYCGVQELTDGRHVLIFSVWDPVDPHDYSADPEKVLLEHRAKVLYADPSMNVARFGGEGTGARTMAGYDWEIGKPVRFKVEASPDETNRTAFTCYLQDSSDNGSWRKLASISTMNREGKPPEFGQLHSFVEDFRRNYESAKKRRRAEFSNVEALIAEDGQWRKLDKAIFTADNTPSTNVDAGRVPGKDGTFFLANGGDTKNETTPLWNPVK